MSFKARHDIHLARRLWHFCGVMFIFFLAATLTPRQGKIVALVACSILILLDIFRLRIAGLNTSLMKLFAPFMRESERQNIAGSTFMLFGVTVVVCLFPKNVILLSLLFLGVADPVASLVGIAYGKDKLIGNKSLQGSLAAFATCFMLSLGFFLYLGLMKERLFIVCLLSGLIGAVSELVPIGRLDDNLVFPVMSAVLLTGLMYVFGGL